MKFCIVGKASGMTVYHSPNKWSSLSGCAIIFNHVQEADEMILHIKAHPTEWAGYAVKDIDVLILKD